MKKWNSHNLKFSKIILLSNKQAALKLSCEIGTNALIPKKFLWILVPV